MVTKAVLASFVACCAAGCTPGLLYTDITTPYCTDMGGVQAAGKSSRSGLKQFSIPRVPGVRASWSSNAIADAANAQNLSVIHYCDREQFSVLGGLWGHDSIVVYGE